MKILAFTLLSFFCLSIAGQAPVYDDLVFESDSTTTVYQPSGKNFASIRSKRGTGGVNKTTTADSIIAFPITDIVLVFTETDATDLAERETANRERWENLLMTYPEFFQFETNFINFCQCNTNGDKAAFKQAQGFYIYYTGNEPQKSEETKIEEKKPAENETTNSGKKK